ncbi:hypothetical protein Hanom_Chr12g01068601 [Helianthus anomalus]
MADIPEQWNAIYDHLVGIAASKMAQHVISKLVVAATAYFVWQERNARLFSNKKRSPEKLAEVILTTVRLKLHTCRFKNSVQVHSILHDWKLPRGLLIEDDDCG